MSASYDFESFGDLFAGGDRILTIFLVIYLIFAAIMLIFGTVCYVLQSLGLYTIAKRRCIHHSWLAWLPIGNMWLVGSISDQYQYVAKGRVRNRRKVLLWLLVAVHVLLIIAMIVFTSVAVSTSMQNGISASITATSSMAGAFVLYMVGWVAAVVAMVFTYIAYYDLYASCNPGNAVVFLVLSIFFNFLIPFFIFACRKKDEGMPPRRVVVPVAPWRPVGEETQPEPEAEPEPIELPQPQEDPQFPDVTEDDFEPEE